MSNPTFDYKKPFQTKRGEPAKLIHFGVRGNDYPFVVLIEPPDGSIARVGQYNLSGLGEEHNANLENIPETILVSENLVLLRYRGGGDAFTVSTKGLSKFPESDYVVLGSAPARILFQRKVLE